MKTHWKKLIDHNFINEGDLDNGNIIATIKSVALEEVKNHQGKKVDLHVLRFQEPNIKPLILTAKINWSNIQIATGTPYIEEWVGKKIEIYYDPKVKFGSEVVGGVRIMPRAPILKLPEMTKNNPKFESMKTKLISKETTLEIVKKHCSLSAELEAELKQLINAK